MSFAEIKKLRTATGASLADCKSALDDCSDYEQALARVLKLAADRARAEDLDEAKMQTSRESHRGLKSRRTVGGVFSDDSKPKIIERRGIETFQDLQDWCTSFQAPQKEHYFETWQLLPIDLPVEDIASKSSVEDVIYSAPSKFTPYFLPVTTREASGAYKVVVENQDGELGELAVDSLLTEQLQ